MRVACGLLSLSLLTGYALTQQPATASPQPSQAAPSANVQAPTTNSPSAGSPSTVIVSPESPKDLAEAKRDFDSGLKLKNSGKLEPAFEKFESAAALNPRSVDYVTAREITRQELVMDAIGRGNKALQENKQVVAMAEFRRALEFDPQNEFAKQRLTDSVWRVKGDGKIHVADSSDEVFLQPNTSHHDFHFRGDARSLFTELGKAYDVNIIFDDSVKTTRATFNIEDVNFATAMEAATRVTKTFWIALSPKQVLLLADTTENRRSFERMSIRTFYMTDLLTPQELADMVNTLRVVLDLRYIMQNPTESTITIRATQPLLDAATKVLENMAAARPEVLLDVRIYQISQSLLRQLGANLPTQFTLFNISPQLIAGLGAGAQDLINQLISSGGINQANSQAIQALIGQLSQNSGNPLINLQPFATFGGGISLMGLSAQPHGIGTTFNLNTSDVKNVEDVQLRAAQNTAATLLLGERYPIVNATYSPIYNTQAIANVIGNGSYIAPIPSVNYEDLGIKLKATPTIHSDKAVTLKLELQLRALASSTVNGIPIINNRQYTGTIMVANGESSVIGGIISEADQRMVNGWPFLSRVPGLTYTASQHDTNVNNADLLIVITPHILRMPSQENIAITIPTGH